MGTFSASICHMVPGSVDQKASSLKNLYICGSYPLKCNFRLSWLLKIFIKGLVAFQEGARCQILLFFQQVKTFDVRNLAMI